MKHPMRRPLVSAAALVLAGSTIAGVPAIASAGSQAEVARGAYLVLAKQGIADTATRAAIARAGGTVTGVNTAVGMYTVTAGTASFATAARAQAELAGVSTDRRIGAAPKRVVSRNAAVEKVLADRARVAKAARATATSGTARTTGPLAGDPLSTLQWDMEMIRAWRAQQITTGEGVRVGILDTGVDANHPDIKANFNPTLSRNFTVDMPDIDGPCAEEPDKSCTDPATVDENGHGTHVAGIIASPRNGLGIVGVAPDAEIVNLRTGQDSGFFFLKATVDALTYAGDKGIDVVNMSFFIDPWLFNCTANPADTAEQQAEQRMTIDATKRALAYAHSRGVTLIAAAGNENLDLDNPTTDAVSPDYPVGQSRTRTLDNSCLSLPNEGQNVISVSSVGPSTLKADYSNWGYQGVDVAAPGGYFSDWYGTTKTRTVTTLILAPMPAAQAQADPGVDPTTGGSTNLFIVSQCAGGKGTCVYYQFLQGTSMAAPHAVGVAALVIGRSGTKDIAHGGLRMSPQRVASVLKSTASDVPCPKALFSYPDRPVQYNATCVGTLARNSWYGHGIVDALAAVSKRR